MKVSVIGATGYAGAELLRILSNHPEVEVAAITSESHTGTGITEIYPHLAGFYDKKLTSMKDLDQFADSQAVFIGLPHGHAMAIGRPLAEQGIKVIDLGADYRFRDESIYEAWYKVEHTHRNSGAVYGLTELYRQQIRSASIVGNAGCYTTASILALAPLAKSHLIDTKNIVVDAKSGVSGAGRGLSQNVHMAEMSENLKAYSIAGHRHTPEIEQALQEISGQDSLISFTPHLIPMSRGILSTCYATLQEGVKPEDIDQAFHEMYGQEFFIRLLGPGGYPAVKHTRGSNFCDLGWHIDSRTNRVIVVSAIDNLVKGAAGQAVQNFNVMFGFKEDSGLKQVALYP
ncbi:MULTISPECIES: N-acetyl-gamma-glutamyl-phosphate reductase [Pelosinus]|uniref:N-acetyl-gamma-glutamyl-phosphate reductase n=1 Tax=Pelosinus fermentans B4 TaxID=1149862 RepID=I8RBS2_9FIRM|nr:MULTISPECIES: N-acetyl-gamma-glutamyl-phosphate reductase [Pelosinus]EIW16503.1 N-acetyl-gamma-glutamyl-phosphate reductase [Pelosinus fermentans B4]EIW22516.1 N-acetyl-gamma-glutamyl-phosphate reductase [Pelosinus fermentans A11]OAM95810.1 N-acetyl-gamma-glutamyl-phosphate reductase [Pelosinus fermentans DSM 17108]SDR33056.1 N-acetyl-gamma-glutamyl-phosphate reductase [Pelosinus fermentans]